jgi:hypothetical protein
MLLQTDAPSVEFIYTLRPAPQKRKERKKSYCCRPDSSSSSSSSSSFAPFPTKMLQLYERMDERTNEKTDGRT